MRLKKFCYYFSIPLSAHDISPLYEYTCNCISLIIWQDYNNGVGNVGEKVWGLPEYLNRPWTRIDDYVAILQDVTKYRCVCSAF